MRTCPLFYALPDDFVFFEEVEDDEVEDGDDEEDVEDEELDEVKSKKYSAVVVLISVLLCKEYCVLVCVT